MRQLLIRPSQWNYQPQNRMFDAGYCYQGLYRRAFCMWRNEAKKLGWELNTWDMKPLDQADVVWYIDLPYERKDVMRARQAAPQAKFVLQIFESPALGPHFFHRQNHRDFDYVLTYDPHLCNGPCYVQYALPNTLGRPPEGPPFADRRLCCMINTNRVEGYFARRQVGLGGLPVVGRALGGWHTKPRDYLYPADGELYSERRRLARDAERFSVDALDVYGPGWQGERISWCPLYRDRSYGNAKGRTPEGVTKQDLLQNYRFTIAYENYIGDKGWIGEKIFDALNAGVVPVYLGDRNINDHVPEVAFVDRRKFKTNQELLAYLKSVDEKAWLSMRFAGGGFLSSENARAFSDEAYVMRMTNFMQNHLE